MILGQDLLKELGLNLKFYKHVIEADDEPFSESTALIVDLGTYILKDLNKGKLNLNNRLLIIMPKKYMSQSMYLLLQNDYIEYYMLNMKKQLYIRLLPTILSDV